jgi:hypothetical protein
MLPAGNAMPQTLLLAFSVQHLMSTCSFTGVLLVEPYQTISLSGVCPSALIPSRRCLQSPEPQIETPPNRSSQERVTPLPLIDSRHETASSVPVAKLRRHVITSPSAARALSTPALDVRMGRASASRPATAAALAATPLSQTYQRSFVYRSADLTLRVPRKVHMPSDELIHTSHDLTDSYMKSNIKQVPSRRIRISIHSRTD